MFDLYQNCRCSLFGSEHIRVSDAFPTTESLHLLTIDKITDEIAVPLASGLEALIEVLKAMGSLEGERSGEARH